MLMRRVFFVLFFITLLPFWLRSQSASIDSLQKIVNEGRKDTAKVNALIALTKELLNAAEYERADQTATEIIELAQKTNFQKARALGHNFKGTLYRAQGKYNESLKEYLAALKIRESISDSFGIANAYNNIGLLYWGMEKYDLALDYHVKALRLRENLGDSDVIAASHVNLGMTYYKQGMKEAPKNPAYAQDFLQSALVSYQKALGYFDRKQALQSMAACYNNMANVFADKASLASDKEKETKAKFYALSIDNYFKAWQVLEKAGDKQSVVITLNNIAYIYREQADHAKAAEYANRSLLLAKEIGARNEMQEVYLNLAEIASETRDFEKAYQYHRLYSLTKDSLLNEESNKQVVEMQTKYESEKKDKELLKKDAETKQAALQRNYFIGGFVLMLLLAFFIFRGYRQKQKANVEISHQKHLVEEKQKEILDSIHYAKRIQRSLLTNEKYIQRNLQRLRKG